MIGHNFDGDVAVGRNISLGGKLTSQGGADFKGNVNIAGWLDAKNIKATNKGLFASEEELIKCYPEPLNGWFALVSDTSNITKAFIFRASDGAWRMLGNKANVFEFIVDSVNMFPLRSEVKDIIEHFHNIEWGSTDNVNDFLTTGVYNIAGIHSRGNDNLPISVGENATFNATLTVLDSTINVLGGIDGGACITQILSISDRVGGEGNVYIRTGRGYIKNPDAITWDSWSLMQTTTDVGTVKDEQHSDGSGWVDGKGMNSLGKAGFYRGLYFDDKNREESFFLLVIDSSPAINAGISSFNYVTQIKYGLPINGGEISLKVRRGLTKQNDLGEPIEGEFDWGEWKDFGGDSTPTITWQGQNLNDYTTAGVYNIQGNRVNGDNMPILNEGVISARLTVLSTDDGAGNTVVTQVLSLNNNSGGEGNVYIRSAQKGSWKPWGKLQTNVEVGQVNTLDNLTDNGMYSGVLITYTGVDTFVLVVINNYAAAVPAGFGWYVSQLKYSLGLDGSVTVKTRRMDYTNTWSEWEELKGGATGGGPYTKVYSSNEYATINIEDIKGGDVFLVNGSGNLTTGGNSIIDDISHSKVYKIDTVVMKETVSYVDELVYKVEKYVLGNGWSKKVGQPYTAVLDGVDIINSADVGDAFICLGTECRFCFTNFGTSYGLPLGNSILTKYNLGWHLRGFTNSKEYKEYTFTDVSKGWQEIVGGGSGSSGGSGDNETIIYDCISNTNDYYGWSLGSFVPDVNSRCIISGPYYDNETPPVKLIAGSCWCMLENKGNRILDITFTDDKGTNLNISINPDNLMSNVDNIRGASISGRIDYDCQFNVPLIFDNVAIGTGASVAISKKDGTVDLIDVGAGCNLRSIGLDVTQNTLIKEYIENGEVKQKIID